MGRLVPDQFIQIYKTTLTDMREDLGRFVKLYIPGKHTRCPNCFTGDTMISIPGGTVPIANISVGDSVITANGAIEKVNHILIHDRIEEMVKLTTYSNSIGVSVTSGHNFFVTKNTGTTYKPKPGKTIDLAAGKIGLGDLLATNIRKPNDKELSVIMLGGKEVGLDDELLFVLGLWIAEGSVGKRTSTFSFHKKEKSYADLVKKVFKEKLGLTSSYYGRTNGDKEALTLVVEVYGKALSDSMLMFGKGSWNKQIPEWLFEGMSTRQSMVLLEGLFCGDGHLEPHIGARMLSTVSEKLAMQVQMLLLASGSAATISKNKARIDKNGIKHRSWYCVRYWFDRNKDPRGTIRHNDIFYSVVKSINKEIRKEKTYNLEVSNDHTYNAASFRVHNCLYDPVNHRSSNVYSPRTPYPAGIAGPIEFKNSTCPVCNGTSNVSTQTVKSVKCLVRWIKKGDKQFEDFGQKDENYFQVKGDLKYFNDFKNARVIEIDGVPTYVARLQKRGLRDLVQVVAFCTRSEWPTGGKKDVGKY